MLLRGGCASQLENLLPLSDDENGHSITEHTYPGLLISCVEVLDS